MTRRTPLAAAVVKELSVGLPVLGAALTAMAVSAALAGGRFRGLGIIAYTVGAAALGSQTFGHEFTLRTMPSLLMLPRSRYVTITVKFAVLVALLLPLAVAGSLLAFRTFRPDRDPEMTIIFWLPLVTAVGVAPWLTLLLRSATAGMAFSLAMPGFMFCVALARWVLTHGFTPAPQAVVFRGGAIGTVAISALGLVLGWRSFQRLEAIEGPANLPVPRWLRRDPPDVPRPGRRFHPLWQLVRKELRLQRMTIICASGYMLGSALLALLKPLAPEEMGQVLTIFYVAMLPFMPGALASAEEHQFGTLAWQATMPVAGWQQWLVKVGVVLGLTVVLAVGLPAVLSGIPQRLPLVRLSAAVLMLAAGSLYVSSACNSTLWALLSAITVLAVVVPIASVGVTFFFMNPVELPAAGVRIIAGLSVAAAVLTLAMFNHRTTDRKARPGWRQAAAATGCAACAMLALFVMI
jgi:hypothetical protein